MATEIEIDAWVSQYVLGHTLIHQKKGAIKERTSLGHIRPLRPYSKDIASAWEVAEKLAISLIPIKDGTWFAMVGKSEGWSSPAEFMQCLQTGDFARSGAAVTNSPAMSICLAALRSIEKREGLAFENIISTPPTPDSAIEPH
jgi:hypothetical protein